MVGLHSKKDELEPELLTTVAGNSCLGGNTRGWGSGKNEDDSMVIKCSENMGGSHLRKHRPNPGVSTAITSIFQ